MGSIKNKTAASEITLFFLTILWGCGFVVVKNTAGAVSPSYLIFLRFSMASVLLCVFFWKKLKKLNWFYIKWGLVLGFFNFIGFQFQTVGLANTTAGKGAFLTSVYCIVVPFLYWFVKHIRPDFYNISSAVICVVGIGFLSLNEQFSMNYGDTLCLLCGLTSSLDIVFIGILTEKCDAILLCITHLVATAVIACPAALLSGPFPVMQNDTVLSILYLGLVNTMISFILQMICQKYTPPSKAALLMSLESVFGTIAGIVFLHEVLTPRIFVGFLLIFIALLICETKPPFLRNLFLSHWNRT